MKHIFSLHVELVGNFPKSVLGRFFEPFTQFLRLLVSIEIKFVWRNEVTIVQNVEADFRRRKNFKILFIGKKINISKLFVTES